MRSSISYRQTAQIICNSFQNAGPAIRQAHRQRYISGGLKCITSVARGTIPERWIAILGHPPEYFKKGKHKDISKNQKKDKEAKTKHATEQKLKKCNTNGGGRGQKYMVACRLFCGMRKQKPYTENYMILLKS